MKFKLLSNVNVGGEYFNRDAEVELDEAEALEKQDKLVPLPTEVDLAGLLILPRALVDAKGVELLNRISEHARKFSSVWSEIARLTPIIRTLKESKQPFEEGLTLNQQEDVAPKLWKLWTERLQEINGQLSRMEKELEVLERERATLRGRIESFEREFNDNYAVIQVENIFKGVTNGRVED